MLIFINYVLILLGINIFCPEGPTCYASPVTCHQSHVTCWPLFNTLNVLPNISIQHIMSVTLPTAMWILPMCFLMLKLDHCLVPQKNPQKNTHVSMAPRYQFIQLLWWEPWKIIKSSSLFPCSCPWASSDPSPPPQPSPRPSPGPWPSSCSPPGGSFPA